MERGVVRGVRVVAAIDAARHDDAHRRLLLLHHAYLDGGSVGAEQSGDGCAAGAVRIPCEIERVLRVPRRMVGGRVQRVKAMIFVLDLRAVGHHEADLAKAADDVLGDLRQRMELAERRGAGRAA